jgi:hypothetical protein
VHATRDCPIPVVKELFCKCFINDPHSL